MDREEVRLRLATLDDADAILEFIKEHWIIENHVFTRRRDLFDNCHVVNGRLTFLLAVGAETGDIYGILGYAFNNARFDNPDISAVIFQTLKTANPSLGIEMILELQKATNCRVLFCPGIIKKTKGIYDFLKYETGKLKHYYRLGEVNEFRIARIETVSTTHIADDRPFEMREFETFGQIVSAFRFEDYEDVVPYRDAWSVERRYFDNIGYDYRVFGIFDGTSCKALVVARTIECNEASMLRIVDYIGDDGALAHAGDAFTKLIADENLEYVDFYEVGIADEYLEAAGFTLLDGDDPNIIPNYFEPYEPSNIDIYYYTTCPEVTHIYRTDSGQDRPNFREE